MILTKELLIVHQGRLLCKINLSEVNLFLFASLQHLFSKANLFNAHKFYTRTTLNFLETIYLLFNQPIHFLQQLHPVEGHRGGADPECYCVIKQNALILTKHVTV